MSRKKVRPLGKAIPYVGRNWTIGGREPKSNLQAEAERIVNRAAKAGEGKPARMSRPIKAAIASVCNQCGGRIRIGDKIVRARRKLGRPHWVHLGCSQPNPASAKDPSG